MEKGEHLKRQNRPTMLQLQYLQGLSRVEKKRGAQGSIAESYGVNRSTVNRYFKNCIERGILTESLEFTAAGEEWLERYTKLYENLEKYLEEIGAKPEEIEESLDVMVENIDIHMLELMINAYTEKKSVYKKKENELDQEIQHNLQKCERHPVVFRLYRMNKKQGQGRDSMAMRGFEDIAEIVQEKGESYLELKLKEMAAHSRVSGEMMAGKLKTLKYEHNEVLEEAKIENIAVITDFVNSILEANGCSAKVQMEIDIAIDEIFGNIAYYAYTPKTGEATVQVEIKNFPERLELTFIDKGIPYNPLENKDPDVTLDIEKRKIGGLGIFLVKEMMDEVSYEYADGQNILKLKKNL